MKQLTAEDYARIAAEARAVRDRALGIAPPLVVTQTAQPARVRVSDAPAADAAERKRRQRQRERAKRSDAGKPKPRGPVFDRAQIAALYENGSGLSISEIARRVGCNRGTVARALKELGIEQTRRGGAPLLETCGRGHDFSDTYTTKTGGRACRECARERRKKAT